MRGVAAVVGVGPSLVWYQNVCSSPNCWGSGRLVEEPRCLTVCAGVATCVSRTPSCVLRLRVDRRFQYKGVEYSEGLVGSESVRR